MSKNLILKHQLSKLEEKDANHWQCLAGSIWNAEPSVQALTYRILYNAKEEAWAGEIMSSLELDESVVNWAVSAFEKADVHQDANGVLLPDSQRLTKVGKFIRSTSLDEIPQLLNILKGDDAFGTGIN